MVGLAEQYLPLAKRIAGNHARQYPEREPGEHLSDCYLALVEAEQAGDLRYPYPVAVRLTIHRRLIDSFRRQARHDQLAPIDEHHRLTGTSPNLDLPHDLQTALSGLKPRTRQMVRLVCLEGQTITEAARIVGRHPRHASIALQAGLTLLRQRLRDYACD